MSKYLHIHEEQMSCRLGTEITKMTEWGGKLQLYY